MKFTQKVLCLFLAILIILPIIVACSNDKQNDSENTKTEAVNIITTDPKTVSVGLDKMKIAFVLDNAKNDGGWSQSSYDAAMRVKEDMDLRDDQVVVMENIDAYSPDAESVMQMLVADGCDLIIGCSSGFSSTVTTVAARNPDVYFAQFEGETLDNAVAYSLDNYDTVFLCGYAAARMSSRDVLGSVASQPQASIIRGLNSFAAGARYANENATVKVLWINSWHDPAKEKEATGTLIEEGCESIGFYGGTPAVAAACQEAGCYTMGYYVDMIDAAPDSILTSYLNIWDPIFAKIITMVAEDEWNNETLFMGINEGACDITAFNSNAMPQDIIDDCMDLRTKVINGEVEVFPTPVYDNKGNVILEEGEEFTMDDFINMTFLLDNVVGSLPKK